MPKKETWSTLKITVLRKLDWGTLPGKQECLPGRQEGVPGRQEDEVKSTSEHWRRSWQEAVLGGTKWFPGRPEGAPVEPESFPWNPDGSLEVEDFSWMTRRCSLRTIVFLWRSWMIWRCSWSTRRCPCTPLPRREVYAMGEWMRIENAVATRFWRGPTWTRWQCY